MAIFWQACEDYTGANDKILERREAAISLAKTLEDDIEVRIDEAEAELNTFSNNQVSILLPCHCLIYDLWIGFTCFQDLLETVQAFRSVQKKHDGLTNKAKQIRRCHEDVIFKRFKEGVDAANKELAVETKKVKELSQITGNHARLFE